MRCRRVLVRFHLREAFLPRNEPCRGSTAVSTSEGSRRRVPLRGVRGAEAESSREAVPPSVEMRRQDPVGESGDISGSDSAAPSAARSDCWRDAWGERARAATGHSMPVAGGPVRARALALRDLSESPGSVVVAVGRWEEAERSRARDVKARTVGRAGGGGGWGGG